MIGVVCDDHMEQMSRRLESLQLIGRIPKGSIQFQRMKMISTDCIRGTDEDRLEVELKRKYNDPYEMKK